MLSLGLASDHIGRMWGSRLTISIMTVGAVLLTGAYGSTDSQFLAVFLFSLAFYGGCKVWLGRWVSGGKGGGGAPVCVCSVCVYAGGPGSAGSASACWRSMLVGGGGRGKLLLLLAECEQGSQPTKAQRIALSSSRSLPASRSAPLSMPHMPSLPYPSLACMQGWAWVVSTPSPPALLLRGLRAARRPGSIGARQWSSHSRSR